MYPIQNCKILWKHSDAVLFLGNADDKRADIIAILLIVLHMTPVTQRELQRHHSCTSGVGNGLIHAIYHHPIQGDWDTMGNHESKITNHQRKIGHDSFRLISTSDQRTGAPNTKETMLPN